MSAPARLRTPARFQNPEPLGQGGMGLVYRVLDAETGRHVALKTLPAFGPSEIAQIKEEFRILSGISHPHLIELYELFVEDGQPFFTMELIDGETIAAHFGLPEDITSSGVQPVRRTAARTGAALSTSPPDSPEHQASPATGAPVEEVLRLARQTISALDAIHAAGATHRDIKPANLMIRRDGRLTILDFGVAASHRPGELSAAEDGYLVGTMPYMAPEQAWGALPAPAADHFSMGVVLFELLTSRLPFSGSFSEMLQQKQRGHMLRLRSQRPDVPEDLADAIRALLDPSPPARIQGWRRLRALANDGSTAPVAPPAADPPFVGRRAELAILQTAYRAVAAGAPRVVTIEGESGIGKSELTRTFLASLAASKAATILRGRCLPQESVPFKAFDAVVDALARALSAADEQALSGLSIRESAALLRLFPVLGRVRSLPRSPQEEPGENATELRQRGFSALRKAFAALGRRAPLAIWVDDWQWADADSNQLLRALLDPSETPCLLLIVSYRKEEAGRSQKVHALRETLSELPAGTAIAIDLGPLDESDALALAGSWSASRGEESGDTNRRIVAEGRGSPYFIRALSQAGTPGRHAAGERLGLSSLLRDRLGELGEIERAIVESVALGIGPVEREAALRVAGTGPNARTDVVRLGAAGFLRVTDIDGRPALEPYHDQVREVVVATMSDAEKRARHLRWAEVVIASPDPDPDVLVEHHRGAGDLAGTAKYAVVAGDRAQQSLAFDKAARLYGTAIETGALPEAERGSVRRRFADALANAGRGPDAGDAYLEAAAGATDQAAFELRRKAAEQFLRGGAFEKGAQVLGDVLRAVGESYPENDLAAIGSALTRRAILRLRGLSFVVSDPALAPRERVRRADACWTAGAGLALIDPLRSSDFQTRHLLQALELGDPHRLVRSLGAEAANVATIGGPKRWEHADSIVETVMRLAERQGEPFLLAYARYAAGTVAFFAGRFRPAFELCDEAATRFHGECMGTAWEVATNVGFAHAALGYLGGVGELMRRAPGVIRMADQRGDVYGSTTLRLGLNILHLLGHGRAEDARRQCDEAIARWTRRGFHAQHYMHVQAMTYVDLYADRPDAAAARLAETWPKARLAQFFRVALIRTELLHLRARCAVASLERLRGRGGLADRLRSFQLRQRASSDAAALMKDEFPSAPPLGRTIRAALAAHAGDRRLAEAELSAARDGFREAGMRMFELACDRHLGAVRRAPGERDAAEHQARESGVAEPASFLAMLVPGFRDI